MTVVNLTTHTLRLMSGETVPPSGIVARTEERRTILGSYANTPLVQVTPVLALGVPNPAPDTIYIVPSNVARALPDRTDLFVPVTIRDSRGQVVGCKEFRLFTNPTLTQPKE